MADIPGKGDCAPLSAQVSLLTTHILAGDLASFERDARMCYGDISDSDIVHCRTMLSRYYLSNFQRHAFVETTVMKKLTLKLRCRMVDVIRSCPRLVEQFTAGHERTLSDLDKLCKEGVYMDVEPAMVAFATLIKRRVILNNFCTNNVNVFSPLSSAEPLIESPPPRLRLHDFSDKNALSRNPNHFSAELPPEPIGFDRTVFASSLPPLPPKVTPKPQQDLKKTTKKAGSQPSLFDFVKSKQNKKPTTSLSHLPIPISSSMPLVSHISTVCPPCPSTGLPPFSVSQSSLSSASSSCLSLSSPSCVSSHQSPNISTPATTLYSSSSSQAHSLPLHLSTNIDTPAITQRPKRAAAANARILSVACAIMQEESSSEDEDQQKKRESRRSNKDEKGDIRASEKAAKESEKVERGDHEGATGEKPAKKSKRAEKGDSSAGAKKKRAKKDSNKQKDRQQKRNQERAKKALWCELEKQKGERWIEGERRFWSEVVGLGLWKKTYPGSIKDRSQSIRVLRKPHVTDDNCMQVYERSEQEQKLIEHGNLPAALAAVISPLLRNKIVLIDSCVDTPDPWAAIFIRIVPIEKKEERAASSEKWVKESEKRETPDRQQKNGDEQEKESDEESDED